MSGTDEAWIRWGEEDPYFAVITDAKFRGAELDANRKQEFFQSGRHHVDHVLEVCRRHKGSHFEPSRALDFGCGVGRVVIPMAEQIEKVVGIDISAGMLAEARRNCQDRGLNNIELFMSDDNLSALQDHFDLVHSCIVFQHIEVPRGRRLFARLLQLLSPGGMGAIQVTYAKASHPSRYGQPPAPRLLARLGDRMAMQMNAYSLSELAFLMQSAGVKKFSAEFTDHGGELGVFLFFEKPMV
jgi:ubiquinone/menaquinone biosynthesis C-methylase UbiE